MSPYYFSEAHDHFRQSLRAFLRREVQPHLNDWESRGEVPREIFRKFGEQGWLGLMQKEKWGGMEADFFFTVVLLEEMQRVNSGGFAAAIGAHAYLALSHLGEVGSDYLKEKYLKPGIAGQIIGGLAVTEPGGGSDVAGMRTTARDAGSHWVLNGAKTFITNGVNGDFLVVAAKTRPGLKAAGISLFVLDTNSPGFSSSKLNKLGWLASDTGEIGLDEVKVPKENLLGKPEQGFIYIMQRFALERLIMAIGGMAAADFALETTLNYMDEREAFGRKLNRFQELRHRIATLASKTEAQRYFIYHICRRFDQGENVVKEAAMAKLLATQLSDEVITQCLQMHGGYGFMEDFPLARMFRDSRLGTIGGGTSEIMCEIIAKMVIDKKTY